MKALIVVAHPDDEFSLAATAYRITRELFGTVDQVVITNGAGGYRYASLAAAVYGVPMRARLPEIRKQETLNAGRILGIRRHHFLEQADSGFDGDCAAAACDWDNGHVRSALDGLLRREHYDVVFTLLPRGDVHAHHRMAAVILLEAVAALPEASRPVVLGAEPGRAGGKPRPFPGLEESPLTRTIGHTPAFAFDRNTRFGHDGALNYHIVVNWVIAEHKSQGLFQTHCGKYDVEQFWAFAIGAPPERIPELARRLPPPTDAPAIYQDWSYPASI